MSRRTMANRLDIIPLASINFFVTFGFTSNYMWPTAMSSLNAMKMIFTTPSDEENNE